MNNFVTARILKHLKEIKPSLSFRYSCRDKINAHIRAHDVHRIQTGDNTRVRLDNLVHLSLLYTQRGLTSVLSRSIAVACVVMLSGGVFLASADDTVPGDTLYPIKIMKEKVSLMVTTSPNAEAELRLKYASRRIVEAQKLAERDAGSNLIAIKKTVTTAKAEVVSARELLDVVKQDANATKSDSQDQKNTRYFTLSQTVQNTAGEISETLKNMDIKSIDTNHNNVIDDAQNDLDTLSFSVFKDLVMNFEAGNISPDVLTKKDISDRIIEVLGELMDIYTKEIKRNIIIGNEFLYIDSFEEQVRYNNLLEEQKHYRLLDQQVEETKKSIEAHVATDKFSDSINEIQKLQAIFNAERTRQRFDDYGRELVKDTPVNKDASVTSQDENK